VEWLVVPSERPRSSLLTFVELHHPAHATYLDGVFRGEATFQDQPFDKLRTGLASGFTSCPRIARLSGLAPYTGSKPALAISASAASLPDHLRIEVGGHHDHGVLEIHGATLAVGHASVVKICKIL